MNTKARSGGLMLVAMVFVMVAVVLVLQPDTQPEQQVYEPTVAPTLTPAPTETGTPTPSPEPSTVPTETPAPTQLPTADADIVATSVAVGVDTSGNLADVERNVDAYTIDYAKARGQVIQYEVQRGDSVYQIAQRYGISLETLIWSNGAFYVNALRPGLVLNILPVDGAMHNVDEPITIADLAEEYQVDPYIIIDSAFNDLKGAVPSAILPVGLNVVIEGGTGKREPIYWDPRGGASTTVASSTGVVYQGDARWGAGQAGTCGNQAVYDGTVPSVAPVSGYVTTQDFTWTHRGLDLSANEGTPVRAVGAGTVIFAGWSDWGYGYAIVVAHGPVMSLYAHLTGAGFVWCGMHVEAGQHIGNVGSTGNSSGPHLHFEIRDSNGIPQNPRSYLGFAACRGDWCVTPTE